MRHHSQVPSDRAQGSAYRLHLQLSTGARLEGGVGTITDDAGRREQVAFSETRPREFLGTWTCAGVPCARGARREVTLTLPLVGIGEAAFTFLIKVYPPSRARHGAAGSKLRSVALEFREVGSGLDLQRQQWIAE